MRLNVWGVGMLDRLDGKAGVGRLGAVLLGPVVFGGDAPDALPEARRGVETGDERVLLFVERAGRVVERTVYHHIGAAKAEIDVKAVFHSLVYLVNHQTEGGDERLFSVMGTRVDNPLGEVVDMDRVAEADVGLTGCYAGQVALGHSYKRRRGRK